MKNIRTKRNLAPLRVEPRVRGYKSDNTPLDHVIVFKCKLNIFKYYLLLLFVFMNDEEQKRRQRRAGVKPWRPNNSCRKLQENSILESGAMRQSL